ncbi:MAG: tRNA lysidine(34) synthetase TilS [Planctomycetota bacterium]|nr:MAG: tRNA lysidine(34) synthetase TilS [Planctomycetota bacterium]
MKSQNKETGGPEVDLWAQAGAGLEALGPWSQRRPALLAASGGADSTFLALAFRDFAAAKDFALEAAVVDHGHRPGSGEEAQAAAALLRDLGYRVEVLAAGAPPGANEDVLRRHRYAALRQYGCHLDAGALLFAHHADDQVETLLLRLLRGTGLRGLAGMPSRRPLHPSTPEIEIRRPLLALRRQAIREALRARGQRWISDPSNRDPEAAARNRLRLQLWPLWQQLASGDPVAALLRLIQEAEACQQGMTELAEAGRRWQRPFSDWPVFVRRQWIAAELRALQERPSPVRVAELEAALLRRGSAAVNGRWRLSLKGGFLSIQPRADPQEDSRKAPN